MINSNNIKLNFPKPKLHFNKKCNICNQDQPWVGMVFNQCMNNKLQVPHSIINTDRVGNTSLGIRVNNTIIILQKYLKIFI